VAWQAPGWVIAGVALFWLRDMFGLSAWTVTVALALYVAKDLVLYPAMRAVFRAPVPTRPIGRRAEAVERLAPSGYVRVDGELWKARARGGDVARDEHVIVQDADGLTLIVEKSPRPRSSSA
jgi:membrane protein implicated in regulation of membrane protease activity